MGHTGNRAQLPGATRDTPIACPRVMHSAATERPQIDPHVCSQGSKNRRFCYSSYIHRREIAHSLLHLLLQQLQPPTMQLFSEATHHRHAGKTACKFLEAQKPAILLQQLHPPTGNTPFAATSLATAATATDGAEAWRGTLPTKNSQVVGESDSEARGGTVYFWGGLGMGLGSPTCDTIALADGRLSTARLSDF